SLIGGGAARVTRGSDAAAAALAAPARNERRLIAGRMMRDIDSRPVPEERDAARVCPQLNSDSPATLPRRTRAKTPSPQRRVSAQDGGSRRVGIWGKSVAGRSRRSGRADGLDGDRLEGGGAGGDWPGPAGKQKRGPLHRH